MFLRFLFLYICSQATLGVFGDAVEYISCPTIRDIFSALSDSADAAISPQENSTFAAVAETYDQLRRAEFGDEWRIVGETVLSIQHCLFVVEGVRLEEITQVLSHEQALGQCNRFLTESLPWAKRVKVGSTAGAVEAISKNGELRYAAAIGPRVCGTLFQGVELLRAGVQDENDNFTKFFIIAKLSSIDSLPLPPRDPSLPHRAIIQFSPPLPTSKQVTNNSTTVSKLSYPPILPYLNALSPLALSRLDRRASLVGTAPFHDVYFAFVEGASSSPDNTQNWIQALETSATRIRALGGDARVLGYW
jgi:prephenate dehydratase